MDNLFERLFNIYISEEFDRNSIYYDEKTNQKFSYKKIVNYLEKYFRHNTIDEEKMCLYHEKRRNIDFFNVNIVYHKKIFSKFIDGDFNYIEDAIKYVERYSSKEELEQYKNILKKYYTQYQSDFEKFENNRFIDSYNNPAHKELPISLLMHEYVTYILKEDYLMYKRKKSLTTSKSYIYLTKILECDNLETFAKELYEQKIEIIDLSRTYDFVLMNREVYNLTKEEANYLENKLISKIKELRLHLRKLQNNDKNEQKRIITEKSEMEKLSLCNELVEKYINSDFNSIKAFCEKYGISYENFKKYTEIVKKYNPELYKKFAIIVKRQQAQRYMGIVNILNKTVDGIINGIEIDSETKRKFDIIDYYSITNISFEILLKIAKKELSDDKLRLFRKFVRKYNNCVFVSRTEILEERNIIMLNNKQYEVTNEDKINVFNYLERNNIPLLASTYPVALKRYLNNNLPELTIKENSKTKVLK